LASNAWQSEKAWFLKDFFSQLALPEKL